MQELSELNEGDELHVTIEGDKTLPLAVGGIEATKTQTKVWLHYDSQEYAYVTPSSVTNDDHDRELVTLHGEETEVVGVEEIEVLD